MIRQRGLERDLKCEGPRVPQRCARCSSRRETQSILGFGSDAARSQTDFWGGGVPISEHLANAPGGPYLYTAVGDVTVTTRRIRERALRHGIKLPRFTDPDESFGGTRPEPPGRLQ
jgi:hypothetical protein